MNDKIDAFDTILKNMVTKSLFTALDASFIDLHLLTLHQELNILKDFEAVEEQLSEKVNNILKELINMEELMNKANGVIDQHQATLQNLQEKEKEIQEHFQIIVQNNKFYDFLRKIFRKRYKPPKVHTDGKSDTFCLWSV